MTQPSSAVMLATLAIGILMLASVDGRELLQSTCADTATNCVAFPKQLVNCGPVVNATCLTNLCKTKTAWAAGCIKTCNKCPSGSCGDTATNCVVFPKNGGGCGANPTAACIAGLCTTKPAWAAGCMQTCGKCATGGCADTAANCVVYPQNAGGCGPTPTAACVANLCATKPAWAAGCTKTCKKCSGTAAPPPKTSTKSPPPKASTKSPPPKASTKSPPPKASTKSPPPRLVLSPNPPPRKRPPPPKPSPKSPPRPPRSPSPPLPLVDSDICASLVKPSTDNSTFPSVAIACRTSGIPQICPIMCKPYALRPPRNGGAQGGLFDPPSPPSPPPAPPSPNPPPYPPPRPYPPPSSCPANGTNQTSLVNGVWSALPSANHEYVVACYLLPPTALPSCNCNPPKPIPGGGLVAKIANLIKTIVVALPSALETASVPPPVGAPPENNPTTGQAWTPDQFEFVLFDNEKSLGGMIPYFPNMVASLSPSGPAREARALEHLEGHANRQLLAGVITGVFTYDSNKEYFVDFTFSGSGFPSSAKDVLRNWLVDTIYAMQPWLIFDPTQVSGSPNLLVDMVLTYDLATKVVTAKVNSGNYLFLLDAFASALTSSVGLKIKPTNNPSGDAATLGVSMSFQNGAGLTALDIALATVDASGKPWTLDTLAARFGFVWPLVNDMFSISSLRVIFNANPAYLSIAMKISIPSININNMAATLIITSGPTLVVQLSGAVNILPGILTLTNVTVSVQAQTNTSQAGLLASVDGILINKIPVAATLFVSSPAKKISLGLTATDVNIADLLDALIPVTIPPVLLNLVKPLSFATVSLTYANSTWSFQATPSVSSVTGSDLLSAVVGITSITPNSFLLTYTSTNGLDFAVKQSVTFNLPTPFTDNAVVTFDLDTTTKAFSGGCVSHIKIPGVTADVGLSVTATISLVAGARTFAIAGSTISPIAFTNFPFITFNTLAVKADFDINSFPPKPTQIMLSGSALIVSVPVSAVVTITNPGSVVAFTITATNVSVANIIKTILPSVTIPNVILDFLNPIYFSSMTFSYNGAVSFSAVPAFGTSDLLQAVKSITQLDPTKLTLAYTSAKGLTFAFSQSITIPLDDPFTSDAVITFGLDMQGTKGATFTGAFATSVKLPLVKDPVGLALTANIAYSNGSADFSFTGSTTSPIVFTGFPASAFSIQSLAVAIDFSFPPLALQSATFTGACTLASVALTAEVKLVNPGKKVTLKLTADTISVVAILQSVLPDGLLPDAVAQFLSPLTFSGFELTWNGKLAVKASPSIPNTGGGNAVALIRDVVNVAKADVSKMLLSFSDGTLDFSFTQSILFALPAPFTKPANVTFGLDTTSGVSFTAMFASAIGSSLLQSDVGLALTASITRTGGSTKFSISGSTTSIIAFKGVNFVKFGTLSIDAAFTLQPSLTFVSLTLKGQAILADTITIDATITIIGGISNVSLTLEAKNVNLATILAAVLPPGTIPDGLAQFITPISFATLTLGYNGKISFSASPAIPDVGGSDLLRTVKSITKVDPSTIVFSYVQGSPPTFAMNSAIALPLPAPFSSPAMLTFALNIQGTQAASFAASFTPSLTIPGVAEPVDLSLTAVIKYTQGTGASFTFSGATLSPIKFTGFSFVTLNSLSVTATFTTAPSLALQGFTLKGSTTLVGVTVNAAVSYTNPGGIVALTVTASDVNLGAIVSTVFPGTPSFITDFLNGISFSSMTLTYKTGTGIAFSAVPGGGGSGRKLMDANDILQKIAGFFGIDLSDFILTYSSANGVTFGTNGPIQFKMPAPFAPTASVSFLIAAGGAGGGIAFNAQFNTGLSISGVSGNPNTNQPVGIQVTASLKPQGAGYLASIEGTMTTGMYFSSVSFISFQTLTVKAVFTTSPFAIQELSLTGSGQLVGITIMGKISYSTADGVSFNITAVDISLGQVIKNIVAPLVVPDLLLQFLNPIAFASLSLAYTSSPSQISFSATPDINKSSFLKAVANALGVRQEDIYFRYTAPSQLAFGISKTITFKLGKPFTKDGVVVLALKVEPPTVAFSATFSTAMELPGVKDPVDLMIGASIGVSLSGGGIFLGFKAALTSQIAFTDFKFIVFNYLSLSATFTLSTGIPVPVEIGVIARGVIFGTTFDATFVYNTLVVPPQMGMKLQISGFDLQSILQSVGVNVNLGPLNLAINNALVSFATTNIPAPYNIPQGLVVSGDIVFLYMRTKFKFSLTTSGVEFSVNINATEFSNYFNDIILGKINDAINFIGKGLVEFSNSIGQAKKKAQDAFDSARADLNAANGKLDKAQADFDAALAQLNAKFAQAQRDVDNFKAAFDQKIAQVNAYFQQKKNDLAYFQQQFDNFRNAVYQKFNDAINYFNNVRNDWNNKINSAISKLQGARDWANNRMNEYNNQCCKWTCPWGCPVKAALWLAAQAAYAAADVAEAFLNGVRAAGNGAISAAQGALNVAQSAVNAIFQGAQYAAVLTATAALNIAQGLVNGLAQTAEAIAYNGAKIGLSIAQAAVNGISQAAVGIALGVAKGALLVAQGVLNAANAVLQAALGAFQAATNAIGSALASVKIPAFLTFGSFSIDAAFTTTKKMVTVAFDFSVFGNKVNVGPLTIDLLHPLDGIIGKLFNACKEWIMKAFSAIASLF